MSAINGAPHPFPYQGSKRQLASFIVPCIPKHTMRLIEPFAGSAAISVAVAFTRRAERFFISDVHGPLIDLWRKIVDDPEKLSADYGRLWGRQRGRERQFYDEIRTEFNQRHEPHLFLYLLARCVKAAVRYNGKGEFNNSPDNRRLGMHPDSMARNITHTSELFRGRTELSSTDYLEVLAQATADDVVYMDPPYQGVCDVRDHRYVRGVNVKEFVDALADLNRRQVPFIVSYDGRTGAKVHGSPLPAHLRLVHHEVAAGRSTQATLLGQDHQTVESLYLSPALMERLDHSLVARQFAAPPSLFEAV